MFETIEELEKQVAEFEQNILASKALIKSIDGVNSSIHNQQKDFDEQAAALLAQMASIKEAVASAVNEINDNNNTFIADTVKTLTEQIASFNHSTEIYLENFRDSNDSQLKGAVKSLSDSQKEYTNRIDKFDQSMKQSVDTIVKQSDEFKTTANDAVEEMKTANQSGLDAAVKKLTDEQEEHIKRLDSFEASTQKSVDTIVKQSDEFKTTVTNTVKEIKFTNQEQLDAFLVRLEKEHAEYLRKLETVNNSIAEMEKQLQEHYSLFLGKLETTNISTVADEIQLLKKQINTKFAILMGGIGVAVILAVIALYMR